MCYDLGMYLRKTTRRNRDGSTVSYLQLALSEWDSDKARSVARIVYNFGRADQLDRAVLERLCRSIARFCDIDIVDRSSLPTDVSHEHIEIVEAPMVGVIWLVRALCEQLEITAILTRLLRQHDASPALLPAILALLANRLDQPTSKRGVHLRWLEGVYFPEAAELGKDFYYQALDFLHTHADTIEHDVFFAVSNLFNLEVELIFYDTTTAAFSVDEADDDGLRQRGRSKEGGYKIQVVVALAVTAEGIPVRSWVLPGNTADVDTIAQVRADLRGWKLSRVVLVGDAGMDSAANRAELARACGKYVLAVRAGSLKEVQQQVLTRPGRYRTVADNLRVKEVVVEEGERRRRYIVCHNPQQEARQQARREEVLAELEAELAKHRDAKTDRKWVAQLRASHRYGRYLRVTPGGSVSVDRAAVKRSAKLDGKWVLLTNDDSLSAVDTANAYKGLMVIERCFRTMKSAQIELAPLHHRLEDRIRGHVKLCVLALLLQRIIEVYGEMPYGQVRPMLERLRAVHLRTPTHDVWQLSAPDPRLRTLAKRLKISLPKKVLEIQPRG